MKRGSKSLGFILAAFMLLNTNTATASSNNQLHNEFTEIADQTEKVGVVQRIASDWSNHWAKDSIKEAMDKGWVVTTDKFRPNDSITRAEVVKVINRAYGLSGGTSEPFSDVLPSHWFYDEVVTALHNNTISSNTVFRPNDPITRQEFATIISNYETGKKGDSNHDKYKKYQDFNEAGKWALDSIEYVIEKGYMGAGGKVFNPTNNITRAEAITTLARAIDIAQPEPEDGMEMPNFSLAPEKAMKMSGSGGYNKPHWNTIEGTITVKYGDANTVPHSYGSKNQAEYDSVVNFVKDRLKTINFRLEPDWVYLDYYLKGGRSDNYTDSVLAENGITVRYKDWRLLNKYIIIGLENNLISIEEAKQLMVYTSAVSHVRSGLGRTTDPGDGSPYSAYDHIFRKVSDCDASAQVDLIVADSIAYNGQPYNALIGGTRNHQEILILSGEFFFNNGRVPTLDKTDNPFTSLSVVYEAPTKRVH